MTIAIELAPEIEQMVRAKAEARGISVEEYLPWLIARVFFGRVPNAAQNRLGGKHCQAAQRLLRASLHPLILLQSAGN